MFPCLLAIVAFVAIILKKRVLFKGGHRTAIWMAFAALAIVYALGVGAAVYDDVRYQWELNRFDLGGDGFFGGPEITPQQQAAMERLTNDVGRNLSFIFMLIPAFGAAVLVYPIVRMGIWLRGRSFRTGA